MMKRIEALPDGVVGVVASGRVTADDHERVLEPELEVSPNERLAEARPWVSA